MLTKTLREFVSKEGKREQYTKTIRRQYDYRIRAQAKQMLKDLTFLSKYLPESQQKQIFTEDSLLPLIESVINPDRKDIGDELKRIKRKNDQIYVSNRRIFSLCNKLIKIASKAGSELIPFEIANLLASSEHSLEDTKMVLKIENFLSD